MTAIHYTLRSIAVTQTLTGSLDPSSAIPVETKHCGNINGQMGEDQVSRFLFKSVLSGVVDWLDLVIRAWKTKKSTGCYTRSIWLLPFCIFMQIRSKINFLVEWRTDFSRCCHDQSHNHQVHQVRSSNFWLPENSWWLELVTLILDIVCKRCWNQWARFFYQEWALHFRSCYRKRNYGK